VRLFLSGRHILQHLVCSLIVTTGSGLRILASSVLRWITFAISRVLFTMTGAATIFLSGDRYGCVYPHKTAGRGKL